MFVRLCIKLQSHFYLLLLRLRFRFASQYEHVLRRVAVSGEGAGTGWEILKINRIEANEWVSVSQPVSDC